MKTTFEWRGNTVPETYEGLATFHFIGGSVQVWMPSFKKAQELANAIQTERDNVRLEARAEVGRELNKMARELIEE
jgi:hypothetical protein